MDFKSTTFAVSLELCIILFCTFSIIYVGNLRKEQNRWLLFAYFGMGFPFLTLLLGEDRYDLLPYTPFLQNPSSILLFFPAIYLYTLKLVKPNALSGGRAYLLFIPFLLFYAVFVMMGFEHPEELLSQNTPPGHIIAFILFNGLHAIIYLFLTFKLVQYIQDHYQEQFADNSPFITLNWIKWMIYIIIFVVLLRFFISVVPIDNHAIRNIILFSIILVISTLSYYSFQQPQLFSDELSLSRISGEPTQNDLLESTSENNLSDQEKILFIQKLENVMTTQKPFLNPKIRMPELAHSLNIPRHIFSALINEHYQMNFFHFINQYRVEYAKTLLVDKEYQHYTLESIGELSGFNSRSTFNRIFKNVTGKSPKEFQQMK